MAVDLRPPFAASRISRASPSATTSFRICKARSTPSWRSSRRSEEVDVEGVEPMTSVMPMRLPMREDVVTDGEIEPQVLANAPLTEDGFFLVPKVIE